MNFASRRRSVSLTVASLAIFGLASAANASFTNRVLLSAPATLGGGFQGTQNFLSTVGTQTLDISVDFAVWGPGQFNGTYTPFAGYTPALPTDYVYAFQIYNNGPGNGLSTRQFSQLGINSAGGTITSLGKDALYDPAGTDVDTNFAFLTPTGASYLFLVPTIQVNQFSVVLLMSSPTAPTFANATVFDSGLSASGQLPVPDVVPAPTSLGIAALAGTLAARRRRR
jgi:hypothetical protein